MLFKNNNKYTDWRLSREGRTDGRLSPPIPAWEAPNLPPFLMEVVKAGQSSVEHISESWKKADEKLHSRWEESFRAFVDSAEEAVHPIEALDHAETQYQAKHRKKAPTSDARLLGYRAAGVLFAVGEMSFNEIAFRAARESELMTAVCAVAVTGSVVLCAHLVGLLARRRQLAGAAGLAVAALGVIAGIAWFRAVHLANAGIQAGPLLFAYFAFNLLLFVVMTAFSYVVHDEELTEIFKWRSSVAAARSRLRASHQRFTSACALRRNRHAQHLSQAISISSNVERLAEVYKTANLRARKDRNETGRYYPKCFECLPKIEIPAHLQELTWEAPTEATNEFVALSKRKDILHDIVTDSPETAEILSSIRSGAGSRGAGPVGVGVLNGSGKEGAH